MIQTPYYLIDKAALLRNLQRIQQVREQGGARVLLALKCFATWSVFDFMRPYMDGTTSSSLNELRLGHDRFGGESHAYSVAWAEHEMEAVLAHADKIIFNSAGQLERFAERCSSVPRGLRLHPGVSSSSFDLADPARPFSRLGPDVEAGPDRAQMPAGARGSQQQGAALGRLSRVKHPAKNGERMPINSQPNWRDGSHTDTLCTNFPAAANRFHERHHSRHG